MDHSIAALQLAFLLQGDRLGRRRLAARTAGTWQNGRSPGARAAPMSRFGAIGSTGMQAD